MKTGQIKLMVTAALCVAIGIALPQAFHVIPNAGSVFLPMHIPVLVCGLVCGWHYGVICGILTPFLSSVLTGMPPMAYLPAMLCELAVYGLVTGVLSGRLHLGKPLAERYIALIVAMLAGRLVMGAVNALVFRAGSYSLAVFTAAAFVTALPGIVIQLLVIPTLVLMLEKAGVIPSAHRTSAARKA
ncbi:MAG: ECF transporter S component [Clostridia bacterium]|nr:ECF transporter S component [Clostridia bacterium]